jgi:hypothetical protein
MTCFCIPMYFIGCFKHVPQINMGNKGLYDVNMNQRVIVF